MRRGLGRVRRRRVLSDARPLVADVRVTGGMRRAEGPEQSAMAGASASGATPDMLDRHALAIAQAAPFALLVAEPSQIGERAAGEPLIGDPVDPLPGTALRQRKIGPGPDQGERRCSQREEELTHAPRSSNPTKFLRRKTSNL